MKKARFILVLLILGVLTGCVKFNGELNIKKDKSMDFKIIYALDKTYFNEDTALKEADFEEVKKEGFTVSKYSKDNFEGFEFVRKIKNIDDVSSESDAEYDLSGLMKSSEEKRFIFRVVRGEKKNTYYAKLKFNASDSGLNTEEDLEDDELLGDVDDDDLSNESFDLFNEDDLSSLMANMDLSFTVNLPNSAISNNATKQEDDNKKLTWNLMGNGDEYMEFAFELENTNNNMTLYIGIGATLLIVIVLVILLVNKKNTPKAHEVSENNTSIEETSIEKVNDNNTSIEEPTIEKKENI